MEEHKAHVSKRTGEIEWYTPQEFTDAARRVMGEIDLDPASNKFANEKIGAINYYTKEQDGLILPWKGRIWMNPPFGVIIKRFIEKLCIEFASGNVTEAIVLTNNATETNWFKRMTEHASIVCFVCHRISFWHQDRKKGTALQGQTITYFGQNHERFVNEFSKFGFIAWIDLGEFYDATNRRMGQWRPSAKRISRTDGEKRI